jgi:hypothetical protein
MDDHGPRALFKSFKKFKPLKPFFGGWEATF